MVRLFRKNCQWYRWFAWYRVNVQGQSVRWRWIERREGYYRAWTEYRFRKS